MRRVVHWSPIRVNLFTIHVCFVDLLPTIAWPLHVARVFLRDALDVWIRLLVGVLVTWFSSEELLAAGVQHATRLVLVTVELVQPRVGHHYCGFFFTVRKISMVKAMWVAALRPLAPQRRLGIRNRRIRKLTKNMSIPFKWMAGSCSVQAMPDPKCYLIHQAILTWTFKVDLTDCTDYIYVLLSL